MGLLLYDCQTDTGEYTKNVKCVESSIGSSCLKMILIVLSNIRIYIAPIAPFSISTEALHVTLRLSRTEKGDIGFPVFNYIGSDKTVGTLIAEP